LTLPDAANQALQSFRECSGWEQRARLLMLWGTKLETLDESARIEANRVSGCESNVWLTAEQHSGRWVFTANSDARLISGLLAVLLARVNGLNSDELTRVDLADWFRQLGLERQLSPSRSNGLHAVLLRMQELSGVGRIPS
jgi:cysteine desulfuration protein SufE